MRFDVPTAPGLPAHIDPVNQTAQAIFTYGQAIPIAIFLLLTRRYQRAYQSWVPWLILTGGLFMSVAESPVDHDGLCWFPTDGQIWAFHDDVVSLPVWLVIAYVWFFGGRSLYVLHSLEQGRATDPSWWFKNWAIVFGIDIAFETVGLYMGIFLYYGHQPFVVGRFPLSWAAINSLTPLALGALVFVLRPYLKRAKSLLLVPLAPAVCAGVNAATGWITWGALNDQSLPAAAVWAATVGTFASALLLVCALRALVEVCTRAGVVSLDGSRSPQVPSVMRRGQLLRHRPRKCNVSSTSDRGCSLGPDHANRSATRRGVFTT